MAEPTLYERLGGIFAIAAVVDNFSDRLLKNPKIVEANPELHEWHTETYHAAAGPQVATNLVARLAGGGAIPLHRQRAARCTFRPEDPTRGVRRSRRGTGPHPG